MHVCVCMFVCARACVGIHVCVRVRMCGCEGSKGHETERAPYHEREYRDLKEWRVDEANKPYVNGRRLLRRGSEQGMERAVDTEHQWNHCIYENATIKSIIKCVNWKQKKRTNKIRNPTKLFFKQILLDPGQLHCSQPCAHLPASYSHRSRAGSRAELFLKQQKQQTIAKASRRPFCTYWNNLWFYLLTLFHFAWGEVLGIKPTALQNTLFFISDIGHINRLS